MAESTLSLSRNDLRAAAGKYLGFGRGTLFSEPAWTTDQANDIDDCVKTGLGWFYSPMQFGRDQPHRWSFLRPFATFTLASGESTVAMPDGFAYFEGDLYITTPATAWRRYSLQITQEGPVQALHAAQPDTTGAPRIAATQILPATATEGSRYNLYVWPKADQDYTLAGSYKYHPDALTDLLPYPPGGSEHGETIKAAILAACEVQLDDVQGVRYGMFVARLTASIAVDNKKKGQYIGYNGDNSDMRGRMMRDPRWRDFDNPPVTYNGNPIT